MKKLFIIAASLLLPLAVAAQDFDYGARASAGVDVKIKKGFHISAEEEIRVTSSGLDDIRTSLGLDYKMNSFLKLGMGYTLINPYKTSASAFNNPRHRIFASVTGTYKVGYFTFSLREKLMMTHRTGDFNEYQNTRNSVALRTRLGFKYKGFLHVSPFAYFDLKTVLNDPWGSTSGSLSQNSSGKYYYAYTHSGYNHAYNSRYRLQAGAEIKLSRNSELTPYVLLDYCSEYEIDTNSDGTKLFTETTGWEDTIRPILGLSYTYKF